MTIEKIQELIKQGVQKKCKKCGENKPVSEFFIKKCKNNKHNRFNTPCKTCNYESRSESYFRNYLIKRNFGISILEYNEMLKSQNYKCAICGIDRNNYKREFSIDHCHNTGKIRGLLCTNCNTGIGMFKDNITTLHSAIKYLNINK